MFWESSVKGTSLDHHTLLAVDMNLTNTDLLCRHCLSLRHSCYCWTHMIYPLGRQERPSQGVFVSSHRTMLTWYRCTIYGMLRTEANTLCSKQTSPRDRQRMPSLTCAVCGRGLSSTIAQSPRPNTDGAPRTRSQSSVTRRPLVELLCKEACCVWLDGQLRTCVGVSIRPENTMIFLIVLVV